MKIIENRLYLKTLSIIDTVNNKVFMFDTFKESIEAEKFFKVLRLNASYSFIEKLKECFNKREENKEVLTKEEKERIENIFKEFFPYFSDSDKKLTLKVLKILKG